MCLQSPHHMKPPTVLSEACGSWWMETSIGLAGVVGRPRTVSEGAAQHLLLRSSWAGPGSAGISKYLMIEWMTEPRDSDQQQQYIKKNRCDHWFALAMKPASSLALVCENIFNPPSSIGWDGVTLLSLYYGIRKPPWGHTAQKPAIILKARMEEHHKHTHKESEYNIVIRQIN